MNSYKELKQIRENKKIFFNIREGLANDLDMCLGFFKEGEDCILVTSHTHDVEYMFFWVQTEAIFTDIQKFSDWFYELTKDGANIMTVGDDMSVIVEEYPRNYQVQVISINKDLGIGDLGDMYKFSYVNYINKKRKEKL